MVTENKLNKIKRVLERRLKNIVLVLEDIKNKHNAGAILRTCDALGVGCVYFIFNGTPIYKPEELISSSVGSSKWIVYEIFSIEKYENPSKACLENLKNNGYQLVATVVDQTAQNIFEFKWPSKFALLLGNEVSGLSDYLIENSDYRIYIPMFGMVESLNVSVATGIFLYDILLKRILKKELEFIDEKERKEYLSKILKNLSYN